MGVFKPYQPGEDADPDHMIYSGGFFSQHDRRLMDKIRSTQPARLSQQDWPFKDPRLAEMLFRFRARNFPETLNANENELWQTQRLERLEQPADNRQLNPETFTQEILAARQSYQADSRAQSILDHLEAWGNELTGNTGL
jgi:exodeoxyribonuclease-1